MFTRSAAADDSRIVRLEWDTRHSFGYRDLLLHSSACKCKVGDLG